MGLPSRISNTMTLGELQAGACQPDSVAIDPGSLPGILSAHQPVLLSSPASQQGCGGGQTHDSPSSLPKGPSCAFPHLPLSKGQPGYDVEGVPTVDHAQPVSSCCLASWVPLVSGHQRQVGWDLEVFPA